MNRYLIIAVFMAFVAAGVDAHVLSVRSAYAFDRAITRASFAIVYFYRSKLCIESTDDKSECKTITRCYNEITRHNRMVLKTVSNRYRYKMADVQCIVVDVSKSDTDDLMRQYQVGNDEQFLFFRHGHVEECAPCLSGKIERITIENTVEDLWQSELDEIIQKKEDVRRQQADERRMAHAWWWSSGGYPFPCGYSGWGCGYPYYGGCYGYYGGGCGRGYVGFGFGFGC
jgi:hypothetical protein